MKYNGINKVIIYEVEGMNSMNKVGLLLEGGANRGVFTAGVLDYLMEQKIELPYVVSVSSGSCNAMNYVSKQIGRTKACMIPNGRNTPPIHWKHIKDKKTMVNLDMVFDDYPNRLVPFDYDTYFASTICCEYVVTNCITGKAEYLTETKDRVQLMKIGRASCSMPYICPMVMLKNKPYLDGGIADAIPIQRAIDMGYDKMIVVLTREKGYRKKESKISHLINMKFYKDYPELIETLETKHIKYNETLAQLEEMEKDGKVVILRPTKVLAGRMDNHPDHLESFFQQGYDLAHRRIEEIREFIKAE